MKMATGCSDNADEAEAVREALAVLDRELDGDAPRFVTVFTTGATCRPDAVFDALRDQLAPGTRLWGLNSDVQGVIAPRGEHHGLALTGFSAPDLAAGTASEPVDPADVAGYRATGRRLAAALLADAGKTADDPPKIILFAGPALVTNTEVLLGIEDVLGRVPICGGNAGRDQDEWALGCGHVYSTDGPRSSHVSVAALWMESSVGVAYGYPYDEREDCSGVATKADPAERKLYEIDGRPAAEVLNEWTGGALGEFVGKEAFLPIELIAKYALKKPVAEGSPDFVATTPGWAFADNSLFLTHEGVAEGTAISLLELGGEQEIVNKPSILAAMARNRGGLTRSDTAGALVVACTALHAAALEAGYRVENAVKGLDVVLGDVPFSGFYAAGEIGHSPHFGANANRMMGYSYVVTVFGK